ncbi:hypothetical protein IE53DRAFT_150139 [Violaceomyces palustris]|uniref:Uncharacterized protein n=1 Tax=Violaceomyces palustris TaxID=1673888 RepID=A0ACD0NU35_9BASI|nr:hypothetical protein IE53DRAFT_150139 [Violaceomyces palustris]
MVKTNRDSRGENTFHTFCLSLAPPSSSRGGPRTDISAPMPFLTSPFARTEGWVGSSVQSPTLFLPPFLPILIPKLALHRLPFSPFSFSLLSSTLLAFLFHLPTFELSSLPHNPHLSFYLGQYMESKSSYAPTTSSLSPTNESPQLKGFHSRKGLRVCAPLLRFPSLPSPSWTVGTRCGWRMRFDSFLGLWIAHGSGGSPNGAGLKGQEGGPPLTLTLNRRRRRKDEKRHQPQTKGKRKVGTFSSGQG